MQKPRLSGKNKVYTALISALFVAFVVGGVGGFSTLVVHATQISRAANEDIIEGVQPDMFSTEVSDTDNAAVSNPIDFSSLNETNEDIYAWLEICGTDMQFAVLQHKTNDNFYLDHDEEGSPSVAGAIYSQSANSTDFSDPVTVLYGHTFPEDGIMFTHLHDFENGEFFDSHRKMRVYLPGQVLVYEIIAAYEYDNRHILNTHDFSDEKVLQAYFDEVLNPVSDIAHIRSGVQLDSAVDRLLQLSTCTIPASNDKRYIVTGVLVDSIHTGK